MTAHYDVVIPTIGRASLETLLRALAEGDGPPPGAVIVVDDRPCCELAGPLPLPRGLALPLYVVCTGGRGPAAARNAGALRSEAAWIAFLDDDVVPDPHWKARLAHDLADAPAEAAASLGRVRVPAPDAQRPTDHERSVLRLAQARWIAADVALRREAWRALGGFDERFPRAYREDTDLALRIEAAGLSSVAGRRTSTHLLRPGSTWARVRAQRGNADDVLLAALHGKDWRERAGEPRGWLRLHVASTLALAVTAAAAAAGAPLLALLAAASWAALGAAFFAARAREGPARFGELAALAGTSLLIPPAAVAHHLAGRARVRRLRRRGALAWHPPPRTVVRAVLFDRDGTLIHDVPGNADPERVRPARNAARAVARLRAAGVRLGVVTNQAGVAEGVFSAHDVERVNARIEALLGPFDGFFVCPHAPSDGCACRKPSPGLVEEALRKLEVRPEECVLVGDTAADVGAALAAHVRPILVPNHATRSDEVHAAPEVARDLDLAALRALGVVA
jgi:histidinol-phosphate phosphatase family protein